MGKGFRIVVGCASASCLFIAIACIIGASTYAGQNKLIVTGTQQAMTLAAGIVGVFVLIILLLIVAIADTPREKDVLYRDSPLPKPPKRSNDGWSAKSNEVWSAIDTSSYATMDPAGYAIQKVKEARTAVEAVHAQHQKLGGDLGIEVLRNSLTGALASLPERT